MDIKKGSNNLTKEIEKIMKDYGGSSYQRVSLSTLKEDVNHRLDEVINIEKGTTVLFTSRLKAKVNKAKDKETLFTLLSEALFKFIMNED